MSRSELYGAEIEPISGLHYREVEYHTSFCQLFDLKALSIFNFGKLSQIRVKPRYLRSVNPREHFWIFDPHLPSAPPTGQDASASPQRVEHEDTKSVRDLRSFTSNTRTSVTSRAQLDLGLGAGGTNSKVGRLLLKISCRISWRRYFLDLSNI